MKKLFPLITVLLLLIACEYDDMYGSRLNSTIAEFIQEEYRGANIRSAEYDDKGYYEVEIKHDSCIKELYFDTNNNWVYTTWDVKVLTLPDAVKNSVEQAYPGYRIDDADYVQRPEGDFYKLELERGELEKTVYALPDGNIQQ
jgi:hypothetical protein